LTAQTVYTSYDFVTLAGTANATGSADGKGPAAQFNGPEGVAVDGSGNVYVADRYNNIIRKIAQGGVVTTLAGTAGVSGSADGTGAAAQFKGPIGIAVDASGTVYVADTGNFTVRKITAGGVVTTLAGTARTAGSADGTGPAAQFEAPLCVAVDGSGNVYVTDSLSNTIRKITPGGVTSTLAGTADARGSADGTGPAAQFSSPSGIAVDGDGNVYVADMYNCTIRKITPDGVTTTVAGTPGKAGSSDGIGSAALFFEPFGVAADASGNLFVTTPELNIVQKITPGRVVTTIAGIVAYRGSADGTGPAAQFEYPDGVAVDGSGNVYVADSNAGTVRTGFPVVQSPATVSLGNLNQRYDGTAKSVSVVTSPAGLATLVLYGGSPTAPTGVGEYSVFATIVDPAYTGSATAALTIGPGFTTQTPTIMRHSQPGGSFLWAIAPGPAGLVTVGTGGTILSSPDGVTWMRRDSGTTNWLVGVTYGAGQYAAVGDNGTVLLSADGATWLSVAQSATAERLNNVIYAAGQYVAVGEGGAVITSPDGRTWTARSSGVTGWLRGLTYVGPLSYQYGYFTDYSTGTMPARFVASGQGGAIISSQDGITWSNEGSLHGNSPSIIGEDLEALVTTQSAEFAAVGADGTVVNNQWIQMDGTAALAGLMPPLEYIDVSSIYIPVDFRGLVQGASALFATGENGTIATVSVNNGYGIGPWEQVPSGTTADLVGGVAIGDSVFVVGDGETILQLMAPYDSRLINLSCRAQVGAGANVLIAGFVVGGKATAGANPLLIRGSGPALSPLGVPGTLPDPELQLYATASGNSLLASNTGWGGTMELSNAAAELGAFAWADPKSHDTALLETLPIGSFTANISGESGDAGVALAEIYDATAGASIGPATPRLVNLSARSLVAPGANILIAGFVVGGSTPKTVLIRASGPALAPFGVTGTLPDPKLQIFGPVSGSPPLATNTGWGGDAQITTAASWVGAFSWGGSATPDSAVLITLPPGPYTAEVSGASGDGGVALVEVYEVQ
jgi:sugar lactone lactonase YvrE